MSTRIISLGRLIDRSKSVDFSFNGSLVRGFEGDTVASALLANDRVLLGRSFKYHRPRGVLASGAEEPNALVTLGESDRCEPNARATTSPIRSGMVVRSQNHWPSLDFDVGALNNALSSFFPAGFYYKTFIHPRPFWKHVFEPIIRRAAGLGPAPKHPDPDRYEHIHLACDVLVIGGGVAGLQSALSAAQAGARVIIMEQQPAWGGRAVVDGEVIDGADASQWVDATLKTLSKMPNVTMRQNCVGAGVYDHGFALGCESIDGPDTANQMPRHRLWRVRARQIIAACGAIERPLSFANNDVPGVMLASAVRDYLVNYAVSPGDRTVIATNNDDAYRTALVLRQAGLVVPCILDARGEAGPLAQQARDAGVRVELGRAIAAVKGRKRVAGVSICAHAGEGTVLEEIACDAVAMSGGWSPVVHLWSHCGGKLLWDNSNFCFVPDATHAPTGADGAPFVRTAGGASGKWRTSDVLTDAHAAAKAAATACNHKKRIRKPPEASCVDEIPPSGHLRMPLSANAALRNKTFIDFQNDVKMSDIQLAAQEGYQSVEHTKRYTTLGMATDQGKTSNINGLSVLSEALNQPIEAVGTTTFRPPYQPISFGSIAGEAKGELFQPVRKTPMHDWNAANGAFFEPVGQWRRTYTYLRAGETVTEAVAREVTNTRNGVGLLDASTLGKIVVKGPDAGRFLDMLYTNMMSTLKVQRCRYGLMCSENGFLVDDGVVARLDDETFICHTTSGGADTIHAHMEDWLQSERWDWKVWTLNLTEQFAQIAVVGPHARKVLQKLGSLDVSTENLPFMGWVAGDLAGIPVRVYRISFSGELSFEIAVPSGRAMELWSALLAAGEAHDMMPYGTEALHIMRAEKGFIMIGDETDGTIIPQDLGLDWAISKKKDDYIGKRAHARVHMSDPDRWQLVGLSTLDGSTLPDGAYAVGEGTNDNGQHAVQGRVTSTYHSPTLARGIALGLVHRGPQRVGETIFFAKTDGSRVEAQIVDPVFYDPDGDKQNA